MAGTLQLVMIYSLLGWTFFHLNRLDEAEKLFLKMVSMLRVKEQNSILLRGIHLGLAFIYREKENWVECEAQLNFIVAEPGKHEDLVIGWSYLILSEMFVRKSELLKAEKAIGKGIKILEQLGEVHQIPPIYRYSLANIYCSQGKLSEAETAIAITIDEMKSLPQYNSELIEACNALCDIYIWKGRYFDVERVALSVIDVIQRRSGASDEQLADSYLNLGLSYCRQQKITEAEPWLRLALQVINGKSNATVAAAYVDLAAICGASNKLAEEAELLLKAIEIAKELRRSDALAILEERLMVNIERQERPMLS